MSVERIAGRYAKSLVDLAVEQDKLERVREDIEYFSEAAKIRELMLLLKSPIIHTSTKRKVFDQLFRSTFDGLSYAFLDIILRKGREAFLGEIAAAFMEQYRVIRQIAQIKLTTAVPLTDAKLEEIKEKVKAAGVTLPNIEVEATVNPKILGGFVLEFDDRLYDASVAHQLEQMRRELLNTTIESNN